MKTAAAVQVANAWRLLSGAGDIILDDQATVILRSGPTKVGAIARGLRQGGDGVTAEIVRPSDLDLAHGSTAGRSSLTRALQTFSPPVIQIPKPVATPALIKEVKAVLDGAGVKHRLLTDDMWIGFVLGEVTPSKREMREISASAALPLMSLTAWTGDAAPLSRTRLDASRTRAHLLAALVAADLPYLAKWNPLYSPVECLVSRADSWASFTTIANAVPVDTPSMISVQTSTPGSLIVDLMIVGDLV